MANITAGLSPRKGHKIFCLIHWYELSPEVSELHGRLKQQAFINKRFTDPDNAEDAHRIPDHLPGKNNVINTLLYIIQEHLAGGTIK